MADLLNIDAELYPTNGFISYFSGNNVIDGTDPLAMIYAGHQFGQYVPQLGDGRALLWAEIEDRNGNDWEVQLKGAGLTPFSRMGDGRAVLRSTIREYLCSEAMAGLGIPTTRALSITGSDDPVYREKIESSAVLTRLAPSHVQFGHFELFFYRQQYDELRNLADFVISHYFPECQDAANAYLELLKKVIEKTAKLIAQWQLVGFTHGVMNTDNMSILGLTIDYGPFGFLDTYSAGFVCNHTDHTGRYAYDQQPRIGLFNLSCLAQALLPLLDSGDGQLAAELAKTELLTFQSKYEHYYEQGMLKKLGLGELIADDSVLFAGLFEVMQQQVDFTNFFRQLSDFDETDGNCNLRDRFANRVDFDAWLDLYKSRLEKQQVDVTTRRAGMKSVNPKYVLRNYQAQLAITKAENKDYSEVDRLLTILASPFEEQPDMQDYANEPPEWARTLELSCSS